MTRQEHITAAEQLLGEVAGYSPTQHEPEAERKLKRAQVHATLAAALTVPAAAPAPAPASLTPKPA
jgi:hypothetical protein